MRKITFRIWDEKTKKMDIPDNIANNIDWDKFNIMQYTWLKDKNWKEIYENDLIKWWCHIMRITYWKNWFFALYDWGNAEIEYDVDFEKTEIIWNIYKNPNLIINS